jgi:TonB family protein
MKLRSHPFLVPALFLAFCHPAYGQPLAELDRPLLDLEQPAKQRENGLVSAALAPVPGPRLVPSATNAPPSYPPLARRYGQQGRVVLKLRLSDTGIPRDVEVESGSGYPLLDEAALAAVKGWTFQPLPRDAFPPDGWLRVPVSFQLEPAADTATKAGPTQLAPAQNYGARISAAVKPHIILAEPIQGNPSAQVQVRVASDGRIVETKLVTSSGVKVWDEAVLRALQKVSTLPLDAEGKIPSVMMLHLRPH